MNRHIERLYDDWYSAKYRRWIAHQPQRERKNVLVICRRPLGDTVAVSPFLRELKRNRPDVDVEIICSPQNYAMLEKCPYIHPIYVYDDRAEKHRYITNLKRCWKLAIEQLQSRDYLECYVPSTYMPSMIDAWLAYFSGAQRRVAYSEVMNPSAHHQYGGHFNRHFTKILFIDVDNYRHEALCNTDILRSFVSA